MRLNLFQFGTQPAEHADSATNCGPPPLPGCGPHGLYKAEIQNELRPAGRCATDFAAKHLDADRRGCGLPVQTDRNNAAARSRSATNLHT